MGRCRMKSFKICAGRIKLSAQIFLDILAVDVWYACFSRKKVLVFFPLPHNWQKFLFLLHSLSEMLNGHRKKRYRVQLKYKSVSFDMLIRRKKNFRYFWFLICELSWDKAVYYQRECFSQEKGKKCHSVLLSLCRKCYWKLRVRRLPKFLEGHLVCFIFCVTISCGCRLSYAYVPCSFLMFEGALCYPLKWKCTNEIEQPIELLGDLVAKSDFFFFFFVFLLALFL